MQQAILDNRYELRSTLGGGGMGKVFLARDRVLERDVALKVLREQYAESGEFVGRFEREAKAAASLNHPNIVQVYDRGVAKRGAYYIAMEYVSGGTLKERILESGALGGGDATRLALQVADALGVAHASGIVHRDVKPQNVLLTADGEAKVADFGIARAASADPLSNSSLVLGTAKYMSPEQAVGDPIGPESDLYSLGVVLYEMLTGELPFEADSAVAVAMKHVKEPPCPPREKNPAVPVTLDAVTMKLLEKKPEDRYPGAAELVADLSRVGEGLPPIFAASASETERLDVPVKVPGGSGGAVPRLPRRGRRRLLAAAVALVALLGLAGLVLSRDLDGPVLGSLGEAAEAAQGAVGVGEGEVPKVVGLTEREARERLAEEGFGVEVERRTSAEEDEGRVLEQSVPAGREARRGSRIALAVGGGPPTVRAPGLVGLTPSEAKEELERVGLKLGDRKESPSEEVPDGEVAAQEPRAGKEAERGTEVDLIVSSGPPESGEADRVDIPDVSGLGIREAAELLREAGCEVAGTREEPGSEPEGTVIGTDPPIGTAVASGTPVILVLSGGPGEPPADDPSRDYADGPNPPLSSSPASAPADPPPAEPPASAPADASSPSSPAPSSLPPSSAPAGPSPPASSATASSSASAVSSAPSYKEGDDYEEEEGDD